MSRPISLRAVETFVVAARALSLTIAAKQLGLTTSAVSRRMRKRQNQRFAGSRASSSAPPRDDIR